MVKSYSKKEIANFVKKYVDTTHIDVEARVELLDGWTLDIKKNILDDTFEEYRYTAFSQSASMLIHFPFLTPGDKGVRMGYYYPSEDTLHALC